MENQGSQSKWDDLARELGAEISPEIKQREEAISLASQDTASSSATPSHEPTTHAPLPKRGAADWDGLASDLGLPPSEPDVAPAIEVPSPRAERATEPQPTGREPEGARHRERHDRERRPRRESVRNDRDNRGQRNDREHRERDRERRAPDEETKREDQFTSAPEIAAEAEPERSVPPPPSEAPQKPAVSLWHKIFGSPTEQTTKHSGDEGRPEPVRPSDYRDEPRAAERGFSETLDRKPSESEEESDEFRRRDEASAFRDEAVPSDRGRGRPRRRRGRGRGRKSEDRPVEGRSKQRPGERSHAERARPEAEDEFADDHFTNASDDDEVGAEEINGDSSGAARPRKSSALQRAIPSWDEAIGFIVDANLQARSQRRPPSRSGSRENSSRGRSRGRRKS